MCASMMMNARLLNLHFSSQSVRGAEGPLGIGEHIVFGASRATILGTKLLLKYHILASIVATQTTTPSNVGDVVTGVVDGVIGNMRSIVHGNTLSH